MVFTERFYMSIEDAIELDEDMIPELVGPIRKSLLDASIKVKKSLRANIYHGLKRQNMALGRTFREFHRLMEEDENPESDESVQLQYDSLHSIADKLRGVTFSTDAAKEAVLAAAATVPTPERLEEELSELARGFTVLYDEENFTLSIVTKTIEFDDIWFGEFRIVLDLSKLSTHSFHNSAYRVIALDPNPARSQPDITHPHVNAERMCEGDGDAVIAKSLSEARLYDFFELVLAVLYNYNPNGPYVSLDNWEDDEDAYTCGDCGGSVSEDEVYTCRDCGDTFCEGCISYCENCDRDICLRCSSYCEQCGRTTCDMCSRVCMVCEKSHCERCIETCFVCGDFVCDECSNECEMCGELVGECCSVTCSECGDIVCKEFEIRGMCPYCFNEEKDEREKDPKRIPGQATLIGYSPVRGQYDSEDDCG